ncbi:hypothetical protein PENTCL1PPCAC_24611 [Pristionchus entomophagus]|uniref:Guanine nucleotide-binding protein subunit gamma n=1 Tax=Pristionchus entomophagus TaxID=358040 RepID=A0AAV5U6M3_9BILA|nr:hypothetical protein PENTCL1PPCAC_24611 [Pristionchus entomophagus]
MDNIKPQVEQLRIEAQVQRKNVSEVAKNLVEYCEANKAGDALIAFPADTSNPFQEKKACGML